MLIYAYIGSTCQIIVLIQAYNGSRFSDYHAKLSLYWVEVSDYHANIS